MKKILMELLTPGYAETKKQVAGDLIFIVVVIAGIAVILICHLTTGISR
jgi:hypothetical protein